MLRRGRKSAAQTPAPAKDRIYGSKTNPKGSASSEKSAKAITLSDKTMKSLQEKLKEFKEKHPSKKNITLNDLKAVYRRGLGAYSSTHRPTITGGVPNTRNAWAMARVNKFLLKAGGTKVKAAYVQDDDLMKYEDGGLIAPNGKPSNLTPKQYKLVRTPEFKAWFGDWENNRDNSGKVSQITKEPTVWYHATKSEFLNKKGENIFKNPPFFFAIKDYVAKEIVQTQHQNIKGKIIVKPFFVRYKNPFDITRIDILSDKKLTNLIKKLTPYNTLDEIRSFQLRLGLPNAEKNTWHLTESSEIQKYIISKGYDSFFVYEQGNRNLAVFEPNQIKLADGTNTTFDADSDDIRYEDGGLIAPNGKTSNLTPEQYELVRTPEFKAWFGDWENNPERASKVVDENGEPLVVYHGTKKRFNKFLSKYSNQGVFWFSSNKDKILSGDAGAASRDVLIEVFLNAKKIAGWEEYENLGLGQIEDRGFESIKLDDDYVIFEPKNIKLADGTNTTFDADSDDIRYEDGGLIAPNGKTSNLTPEQYELVRTPEFKAWFGDWENNPERASKVVDENGEPLVVYHGTKKRFNKFLSKYSNQGVFWFSSNKDKILSGDAGAASRDVLIEVFLNAKKIAGWEEYENLGLGQIEDRGFESIKLDDDYVIFEPKNIKLADGTNTTFDVKNPDIRFEKGGAFNDAELLRKYKAGESIGFTAIAHLKAKGLIPRADGTKRKSDKYKEDGGSIDKEIMLPDLNLKYDSLKKTLNMQGYEIEPMRQQEVGKLAKGMSVQQIAQHHNTTVENIQEQLDKGTKVEMEHTDNQDIARAIALDHVYESPVYYDKLATIEEEFKDGGVVIGKRHSEYDENGSGEKFLVESTGQVVELEGGEGVLCEESMSSDKKFNFDGKSMTGREIASYLNHKYGGVEFAKGGEVDKKIDKIIANKHVCGCKHQYYHGGELPTAVVKNLKGGEAVVTVKSMESQDKYYFNGRSMTPRQIFSSINLASGGKKFEDGGTIDLKSIRMETETQLAKMMYYVSTLNGLIPSSKKEMLWQSIKDKFSEVFYADTDDEKNEIFSNDVKAEEHVWMFDRYSPYPSTLSWADAKSLFLRKLTKEEKEIITIEYDVRNISEAFGLMWEKKILVKLN